MKITFLGANQQVTGSRYCLEAGGSKIMIDCGLVQEREFVSRNWNPCPVPPNEIDALLLTHIHIDHCGLIPKLVHDGFKGPIHATHPSVALVKIMLLDSARIQKEDTDYKKKRHHKEKRKGKHPKVPLYTEHDAEQALTLFRGLDYSQTIKINDAFSVTFHEAGHILGSAMLEIEARENGQTRQILFSGDIGQWNKPILRDPSLFAQADYVIMESTYGDKDHFDVGEIEEQLFKVVTDTFSQGGKVLIPTFAVERAQELMYYISRLVHNDRIPDVPIYLDSPMAVDVTDIFRKSHRYYDEKTWDLINSDEPPLRFHGLRMVRQAKDSKNIKNVKGPCIIMATSGMCTAGRIKHHLKNNIGNSNCTILFVGYQGRSTLGREIQSGKPEIRIHGQNYHVKASVEQIYGFSGHADRSGLLRWVGNLKTPPRHVFLTHGEKETSFELAETLKRDSGLSVSVPEYLETADLD